MMMNEYKKTRRAEKAAVKISKSFPKVFSQKGAQTMKRKQWTTCKIYYTLTEDSRAYIITRRQRYYLDEWIAYTDPVSRNRYAVVTSGYDTLYRLWPTRDGEAVEVETVE
jgi:hypothetical protein